MMLMLERNTRETIHQGLQICPQISLPEQVERRRGRGQFLEEEEKE